MKFKEIKLDKEKQKMYELVLTKLAVKQKFEPDNIPKIFKGFRKEGNEYLGNGVCLWFFKDGFRVEMGQNYFDFKIPKTVYSFILLMLEQCNLRLEFI